MRNKFENMFKNQNETVGPVLGEEIPSTLKQEAVKVVALANIIEPLAFQLGAVKMANIILESEHQGFSRHWMHWLNEEDVTELEQTMFELKMKVHAQHGIITQNRAERGQGKMYELFRSYAVRGSEIFGYLEHHLGHIITIDDITTILKWIDQQRSSLNEDSTRYRELLKTGAHEEAQKALRTMYECLYMDFQNTELYKEKCKKISDFYGQDKQNTKWKEHFDTGLKPLFTGTLDE
jgi:ribosomal protein S20